jgi:hypothetical protein
MDSETGELLIATSDAADDDTSDAAIVTEEITATPTNDDPTLNIKEEATVDEYAATEAAITASEINTDEEAAADDTAVIAAPEITEDGAEHTPVVVETFGLAESDLTCVVCEKPMRTYAAANSHYKSKPHNKRIELLRTKTELQMRFGLSEEAMQRCETCEKDFASAHVAKSHYEGKAHAKALHNKSSIPADILHQLTPEAAQFIVKRKLDDVSPTTTSAFLQPAGTEAAGPPPAKKQKEVLQCTLCSVTATSREQLEGHLTGKTHAKKLNQLNNPHPPAGPRGNPNASVLPPGLGRFNIRGRGARSTAVRGGVPYRGSRGHTPAMSSTSGFVPAANNTPYNRGAPNNARGGGGAFAPRSRGNNFQRSRGGFNRGRGGPQFNAAGGRGFGFGRGGGNVHNFSDDVPLDHPQYPSVNAHNGFSANASSYNRNNGGQRDYPSRGFGQQNMRPPRHYDVRSYHTNGNPQNEFAGFQQPRLMPIRTKAPPPPIMGGRPEMEVDNQAQSFYNDCMFNLPHAQSQPQPTTYDA